MSKELTQQQEKSLLLSPMDKFKKMLKVPSVDEQFRNAMADAAPLFVASLIDLFSGDSSLQKCEPRAVIMEALKAATLRLPINKSLGFAFIIPYKKRQKDGSYIYVPTFQLGYKGYIQLAMRTGQYACINADKVYEGEFVKAEKLSGHLDLSGEKTSDVVVGYFAYFKTLNGFEKVVYISKPDLISHGKKYSPSFNNKNSLWQTDLDSMGIKTPIRKLFSKYGILSIEMQKAIEFDRSDEAEKDNAPPAPNAGDVIDADFSLSDGNETEPESTDTEPGNTDEQSTFGPDF